MDINQTIRAVEQDQLSRLSHDSRFIYTLQSRIVASKLCLTAASVLHEKITNLFGSA